MRKPLTFFELQVEQRNHDEKNHGDIYTLPLFDKINHYVLHYAKYAARLASKRSKEETKEILKKTFVDAFLISLAASNTLNLDLDIEMRKRFNKIPKDIPGFVTSTNKPSIDELREHSKNILVIATGAMADTMEKRDHLNDKNSKIILQENTLKIIQMLLYGSYHLNFDLVEDSLNRRRKIAELKIT